MQTVMEFRGHDLVDRTGDKVGKIEEIYLDQETRRPEWALVRGGLFGTRASFVPITDAGQQGDDVAVPFEKAQIKDAPKVDPDGRLTPQEERALYSHYGMRYGEPSRQAGTGRAHDGDAMTRSEEELRVGTEREATGTLRLRKWVETENETVHVPVRKERARLEREPIHEGNVDEAMAGPEISEAEHEITLHEERPVVEKQAVPKERVRLEKDVEVEERPVSEELRRERIEVEGEDRDLRR